MTSDELIETCRGATLAVLAGGEGRRMGGAKGELSLEGRPILQRLLDRLAWPGPTLLVTAPGREHPPGWESFGQEVPDPVAGQGPLRGVLTALERAATHDVVVIPVDMPDVSLPPLAWLVARLRSRPDAAAVMIERGGDRPDDVPRLEPLPAAFRRSAAAPIVHQQIADGRLALHALARLPHVAVERCPDDCPDEFWTNLNAPADLAAWRAEKKSAGDSR